MPRKPSAKRYALALHQLAVERNTVESCYSDLQMFDEALQDPNMANFLHMPRVRPGQKMSVIKEGVPGLDPMVYNMLGILLSRGVIDSLSDIREEYRRLLDEQQGIVRAHVTSAVPLTDDHQESLVGNLRKLAGKQIELTTNVDAAIIAGFIARIGDSIIDGSTRTKLRELKKSLTEARE